MSNRVSHRDKSNRQTIKMLGKFPERANYAKILKFLHDSSLSCRHMKDTLGL